MSASEQPVPVDVAIFGGGVAGLWLLGRLRQAGYQAVLLETDRLGAGQTRYAQGIIHGGTKYALTGKLTGSSEAIAGMPARWRACLEGKGELDLRSVRLLSPNQFMWSTENLTSRLAGFFASKLMRSRTRTVEGDERPEVLRDPAFRGQVYRLEEPVLDTASLVKALAEPHRDAIFRLPAGEGLQLSRSEAGWQVALSEGESSVRFDARRLVFAAGKGNAALLQRLGRDTPPMQLRPLNMVMLRGAGGTSLPGELYAHCLGASALPRITITTHYDTRGERVWYMGGQIAEEGVGRDDAAQIAAAKQELQNLFPWLDIAAIQWGLLPIDRAEPRMPGGSRPDDVFADERDGVITAWPTKLALAPRLADEIITRLQQDGLQPGGRGELPDWPHPDDAPLPWQEEERWS
jgi:glycerol-3-phosphate dehydrogenase